MNGPRPRNIIFLIMMVLIGTASAGQAKSESAESHNYTGQFTILHDQFGIWNGREYVPLLIKGINLGISVPGTQPGQLAATREDYRRWFSLIREAGYNSIRIYTLHYPRFYEELRDFNLAHPNSPLLLLQGVWLEEQETYRDLHLLSKHFDQEIQEVVSAIHGDITIELRLGKAFGSFTADVSPWVAGFIIGREIFPEEVALTNAANPGKQSYQGSYLVHDGLADPVEAWMLHRLDSLMVYEKEQYGTLRPTGFSSWPTLDPLSHPTEQRLLDSQEDDQKIDLAGVTWPDSSGGFFIGYHAYPYYPDFIVQDPKYKAASDDEGPNSYLGYLSDLKAHYKDIPLIIAEFGVPSSWGSAHQTASGMDHGGLTEDQQGEYTIRMFENIYEAGCAGGIQFSLIDEWFKQTWITNPYSDRQYRHFWHNITSPEQNFGILSFIPPPEPFFRAGEYPGSAVNKIKLSSDYTFFRVRIYTDTRAHEDDTLWVAFDTYESNLGESILPDGTSIGFSGDTLRAEFALRIPVGGNQADLFVIPDYDVYGVRNLTRIDTLLSKKTDLGEWNKVRWKTNYFYDITQYIGELKITDSEDPYQFLNSVTIFNDSIEIRMPWTLLNYNAPSVRRAIHYESYFDGNEIVVLQKDTLTDGIAVTVAGPDRIYPTNRYSWDFWDYEKILNDPPIERKKSSYFEISRELPRFNSIPVARMDSFSCFPGARMEVLVEDGLLANDFDIDGNALEAMLPFGEGPVNGTLQLHPNGSFYYIPDEGFRGEDFFSYYLADGYDYSSLTPVYINVNYPLGTEEVEMGIDNNRFRIYPNPGEGHFYLENTKENSLEQGMLIISDAAGRELMRQQLQDGRNEIYLDQAAPGIYIFTITAADQKENHRVIIK